MNSNLMFAIHWRLVATAKLVAWVFRGCHFYRNEDGTINRGRFRTAATIWRHTQARMEYRRPGVNPMTDEEMLACQPPKRSRRPW